MQVKLTAEAMSKTFDILVIFLSANFACTLCSLVTIFQCNDNAVIPENCNAIVGETLPM